MEGFGIGKLSIILVIVLVLFGARRIPEISGSIGKGIREFKRGMSGGSSDDAASLRSNEPTPSELGDTQPLNRPSEPKRLLSK